jgi:hypothetical protein
MTMQGNGRPGARTDSPELRFREQAAADEDAARDDATLSFQGGRLGISADEDAGSDPYNRTGRFKKLVR